MEKADIGLIGLAVMGQNLVLNMADHGYRVAVFNRTTSKVDEFIEGPAKGTSITGTHSMEELVESLREQLANTEREHTNQAVELQKVKLTAKTQIQRALEEQASDHDAEMRKAHATEEKLRRDIEQWRVATRKSKALHEEAEKELQDTVTRERDRATYSELALVEAQSSVRHPRDSMQRMERSRGCCVARASVLYFIMITTEHYYFEFGDDLRLHPFVCFLPFCL